MGDLYEAMACDAPNVPDTHLTEIVTLFSPTAGDHMVAADLHTVVPGTLAGLWTGGCSCQ